MEEITPTSLAKAVAISVPYASQIISGKRQPPRSLAIFIFRSTGWRAPVIADLSDDDMETFERVEPWVSTADRQTDQHEAAA